MDAKTLIDKAVQAVGSQAKLAPQLGVSAQRVTDYKNGHVPVPLTAHIRLCDIAGLNDHETRKHLREVAGVASPKHGIGHSVAASIALALVIAAAGVGLSFSSPAMAETVAQWRQCIFRVFGKRGSAWPSQATTTAVL